MTGLVRTGKPDEASVGTVRIGGLGSVPLARCNLAWAIAGCLCGVSIAPAAVAQSQAVSASTTEQATDDKPATTAQASTPGKFLGPPSQYRPDRFAGKAGRYYKVVWGIDALSVKWTESGQMIRFSWRVLDPDKAQVLNDKKVDPSLIDPQAGVSLVVPVVDKVGQLRQSQPPEAGRSYWMAFSNKGRHVKRGDRVNVVIGAFRAENLVVD